MDEKILGVIGFLVVAIPLLIGFLARRSIKTTIEGGDPTIYFSLIGIVAQAGVYLLVLLVLFLPIAIVLKQMEQVAL